MSAVALRRKLLEEKNTVQPAEPQLDISENIEAEEVIEPAIVKRGRKKTSNIQNTEASAAQLTAPELEQKADIRLSQSPLLVERSGKRVQLSSFSPNKKNCQKKSDGSVHLKLPVGERLVILGSYGIQVDSGEATIAGAALYPSETVHWVHAPHCHALPVLRCSDESAVKLLPHPQADNLRKLERLSPVFGNLWNEDKDSSIGSQNRTFQIVCPSCQLSSLLILTQFLACYHRRWSQKSITAGPQVPSRVEQEDRIIDLIQIPTASCYLGLWPEVLRQINILEDPGQPSVDRPRQHEKEDMGRRRRSGH